MKSFSERIAALSPEQRSLFEANLRRGGIDPLTVQPIPRRTEDGPCLLAVDQERLWVIDQMEPGSHAYNVYTGIRLRGPLDAPVMERCLNEIVRRHEILRTTFATVGGRPVQVVHPRMRAGLPVVDLRAQTEASCKK